MQCAVMADLGQHLREVDRIEAEADFYERRSNELFAEYMANKELISEFMAYAVDYTDARPAIVIGGSQYRAVPAKTDHGPIIDQFLARDWIAYGEFVMASVRKQARERADHEAERELDERS